MYGKVLSEIFEMSFVPYGATNHFRATLIFFKTY